MEYPETEKNTPEKSLKALISSGYETHSSDYIREGFHIFKAEAGLFISFTILLFIANIILSAIPIVKGFSTAILAPIYAGALLVAHKIKQQKAVSLQDFMEGTQQYMPLFIVSILPAILVGLVALILGGWVYFKISFLGIGPVFNANDLGDILKMGKKISAYSGRSGWIGIISFLIYTLTLFSILLVLFERFQPVRALDISRQIISKKLFNWMGFLILLGIINVGGAMLLGIGLLITIPTSICALYVAYADVVGMDLQD